MFIAKTKEDNHLIEATQANHLQSYYCPACNERVRLKKGEINVPHFAHIVGSFCSASSEGETSIHLQGKLALFELFRKQYDEVRLEPWLSKIKQRPDLMLRKGNQWFVIEFQCATISIKNVQKRTKGYQQLKLKVIWILGEPYQKKRLQAGTLAKFAVIRERQLQIAFWQQEKGIIWHAWWQIDGKTKLLKRQVIHNQEQQLLKLQQAIIQSKPEIRVIQNELYHMKRFVIGIPWACHPQYPLPGGLKCAQWQVIVYILLALEKQPLTIAQLIIILTKQTWRQFGCVSIQAVQEMWLNYLLADLMSNKLLKKVADKMVLVKPLEWYETYQEKLQLKP
ncbi:competence protein CoiA [Weissella bombi]|uniref:Competence protein CoiA n=1 Tax=Weissella bombi TaxID=1505725 RepID=A0A1C3ZWE5_9LACO|nr:competence protein CoiA family protein [Weissella bombi]SCB86625.1 competence protein CoiA [Weissella bombi]